MNVMIWDKHATGGGIFWLFVCISGGLIYQQAPMRGETNEVTIAAPEGQDVEEQGKLIESKEDPSAAKRRG